jgi:hypothetical protein
MPKGWLCDGRELTHERAKWAETRSKGEFSLRCEPR